MKALSQEHGWYIGETRRSPALCANFVGSVSKQPRAIDANTALNP